MIERRAYGTTGATLPVLGIGCWAFGGGDYWGGLNMTLPFAGHPAGAKSAKEAVSEEDKIESAYRFLLADLMPFGRNAVIRLEHGGNNESTEHYETVEWRLSERDFLGQVFSYVDLKGTRIASANLEAT